MSSAITAGYSMPNIGNTLTTNAAAKANATTSGSTDTNPYSTSNIGSTFLNLLTQELQNQDPTAPMDSTAMVGQMISLNSLNQLMSINQTLSGVSKSSSSSSSQSSTKDAISAAMNALTPPATTSASSSTKNSNSTPAVANAQNANAVNPYLSMTQQPSAGSLTDLAQQQALSAFPNR